MSLYGVEGFVHLYGIRIMAPCVHGPLPTIQLKKYSSGKVKQSLMGISLIDQSIKTSKNSRKKDHIFHSSAVGSRESGGPVFFWWSTDPAKTGGLSYYIVEFLAFNIHCGSTRLASGCKLEKFGDLWVSKLEKEEELSRRKVWLWLETYTYGSWDALYLKSDKTFIGSPYCGGSQPSCMAERKPQYQTSFFP